MIRNAYYVDSGSSRYRDTMPRHAGASFSSIVINRILRVLLENGQVKKSNLCNKTGLNYKVCTKYINFLRKLRWLEIRQDNNSGGHISITLEGIESLRKLEEAEGTYGANDSTEWQHLSQLAHEPIKKYLDNSRRGDSITGSRSRLGVTGSRELRSADNQHHKHSQRADRKSIVIIDDDENALVTYKSFLENEDGLDVRTFSRSKDALEYLTLNADSSDLVLLDIRMPEISGLRIYQAARALNPNVPIIFLSSIDAAPEVSELFADRKPGSKNFLRKPVSRANFIETVRRAIS